MGSSHSTSDHIYRIRRGHSSHQLLSLFVACSASLLLSGCNSTKEGEGNDAGWALYSQHCSVCHGQDGKGLVGPALIGDHANLESYGNALRLLEYMSTAMPQNYPGSLNEKAYRELLELLLVQNKVVPSDWNVESGNLDDVSLKK